MNALNLSPLFRTAIGFDRLARLADTASAAADVSYPPYNIVVEGAELINGLLHVDVRRVVPESAKPRRIAINGAAPAAPTPATEEPVAQAA